jgi:hypothetical protein
MNIKPQSEGLLGYVIHSPLSDNKVVGRPETPVIIAVFQVKCCTECYFSLSSSRLAYPSYPPSTEVRYRALAEGGRGFTAHIVCRCCYEAFPPRTRISCPSIPLRILTDRSGRWAIEHPQATSIRFENHHARKIRRGAMMVLSRP